MTFQELIAEAQTPKMHKLSDGREIPIYGAFTTLPNGDTVGCGTVQVQGRIRRMRTHRRYEFNINGKRVSEAKARTALESAAPQWKRPAPTGRATSPEGWW